MRVIAFNIEEFKSRGLPLGGARPSQFLVEITPPPNLRISNSEKIKFVCSAAQIPPAIVAPVQVAYFGRLVKFKGDREFPDWTVTIQNDADYYVRRSFELWNTEMNTLVSNIQTSGMWATEYKAEATVHQLRADGETIASYVMSGLWPNQIDAIPLNWEAMNQIEMFDVTFSYDYWIPKLGDDQSRTSSEGTENERIVLPNIG